jgi:ArsR family transcriptional regulator
MFRDRLAGMNEPNDLTYMANLYMALADKTRLRLLNIMRDGEVCVGDFIDILGQSQPKISRHLAYLRNAGIVEARRDGKWIHYRVVWPEDSAGQTLLRAALGWLAASSELQEDRQTNGSAFTSSDANRAVRESFEPDVYAQPDITEETDYKPSDSGHNELEEFLL